MKRLILYLVLIVALFSIACNKTQVIKNEPTGSGNLYGFYNGEYKGFKVWVVDGNFIRREIFNEFIYGGNDERYTFVPESEIWIDNSISADEYLTTLEHEIIERNLMRFSGYTYYDAHDSALMLELGMRRSFLTASNEHEKQLPMVSPIDYDSTQEIEELPELIKLSGIYKIPYAKRDGVDIWVVDGFKIRRDIYPDFGFSGNSSAYKFIPGNEIWIDASITSQEIEYSIQLELKEMAFMKSGLPYDEAYTNALKTADSLRLAVNKLIINKPAFPLQANRYRDTGTGVKK
ncbi:MAG: hypothetical protein WCK13_10170 [Ignavibacteriota bacterium]